MNEDEGEGDQLHLRRHRRLPPRAHLRVRRQLLRPGHSFAREVH